MAVKPNHRRNSAITELCNNKALTEKGEIGMAYELDYLTGLWTRQAMYTYYQGLEPGSRVHFMFLDVDNFKTVNDIYGHNEGDALLVNISGILRKCAPTAHAVRMGGDEFVLIFQEEASREELCRIADKIIERVRSKEGAEHILTNISMSIGILYDEKVGKTLEDTLMKSDMAMYHAKDNGKGQYVVFNDIAEIVLGELEMEKRQQQALADREFEVRYVPIIMAQTPRLYMAQAYVVWKMADGRCRGQEEFLPLFVRNGFVAELNAWVLEKVFQDIAAFRGKKEWPGKVGVRISRLQLLNGNLLPWLERLLRDYNVKAEEIELEIDESAFGRGKEGMFANVKALHRSGFRVSLTGVGLDFASLRYWDMLPIDSLKFQKGYLQHALGSHKARRIMKTLMAVGRELKMDIVADGVDSREDIMYLIECGCNAVGGDYFSRPLGPGDFLEFVGRNLRTEIKATEFPFWTDYAAVDGAMQAVPAGAGIHLTEGISANWGGVLFDGGDVRENVLELPAELLASDSYTICMWVKPLELNGWSSVLYSRYNSGFMSLVPYSPDRSTIYRVHQDNFVNHFHDILIRMIRRNKWSFLCVTYDSVTCVGRLYLNGRLAGVTEDIPQLPACKEILLGGDPFQQSFKGYVSGLIFCDSVMTEAEIGSLYQDFCKDPGFVGDLENFWME